MRKNYPIRLRLETETVECLKKEAELEMISLSELCRNKLRSSSKLVNIELMLESLCKKLNAQLNSNRR